jgi:hypothetical protein
MRIACPRASSSPSSAPRRRSERVRAKPATKMTAHEEETEHA